MSAATLVPRKLEINNPDKQIKRIEYRSDDYSISNHNEILQQITAELESSSVVTTLIENEAQQIDDILSSKDSLIKKRNSILDNPFKYYNPFYRMKLKKIDAILDDLDLQLYVLQSDNKNIEANLDRAIEHAKEKLKNISSHL